jgi:regulator of replication initiation timing
MDELNLDDLRAELAELVAEEARLSAERERLHHKIDFGFETSTTREREREVSDRRRELHLRIDGLRGQLSARETV